MLIKRLRKQKMPQQSKKMPRINWTRHRPSEAFSFFPFGFSRYALGRVICLRKNMFQSTGSRHGHPLQLQGAPIKSNIMLPRDPKVRSIFPCVETSEHNSATAWMLQYNNGSNLNMCSRMLEIMQWRSASVFLTHSKQCRIPSGCDLLFAANSSMNAERMTKTQCPLSTMRRSSPRRLTSRQASQLCSYLKTLKA